MNRHMKVLFTASILLNLLLLGVAGGTMAHSWQRHRMWHEAPSGFSPQGQKLVDEAFDQFQNEMKENFAASRRTRADLTQIVEAEQFDANAFERASRKMQGIRAEMMQRRTALMRDLAGRLPAEDRKKLGMRLMQPWRGHGRDKRECASGS